SVLAAIYICCVRSPALAATPTWIGPDGLGASGNWSVSGNWSPTGVPAAGDDATIALANGNSVTVSYDYTGPAITLNSLTLAANSTSGGSIALSMAGNSLTANNETLASGAPSDTNPTVGEIDQSGGANTIPSGGSLFIGHDSADTGTYTLSGSAALSVGLFEYVGFHGTGSFTQSGGSNSSTNLIVGNAGGSFGGFVLTGGSVSTVVEFISQSGTGTLTQSAGTNTISDRLFVGHQGSLANGTINLSGGAISSPEEDIGCDLNGEMVLLPGGTGTVNQSGGTNTVSGHIYLGADSGSPSSYTVSGTGVLTAEVINIGSVGTLNLSGGTININGIARDSGGTFSWTSGTLDFTQDTILDLETDLLGASPTLSGNRTLEVTGNETLGGAQPITLTVNSGGAHTVTGTITVNSGSSLKLSGGTITVGGLNLGATPSRLDWTSGTLNFTNSVTFDPGATGSPTSVAFGHGFTLFNSMTLNVTGDETVGGNQFFLFGVSGVNNVTSTLTVSSVGEMTVSGTVTAAALHNLGPLNFEAGSLTAGSVTLDSAGQIAFALSGTVRGTGYGTLIATGNATLAGSLIVTSFSFTPTAGNVFDILDWGTRNGKFSSISLPTLSSGLTWSLLRLYSSGQLVVANSTLLPGDFNRDSHVDAADIPVMEQALTNQPAYELSKGLTAAQVLAIGDLDGDGKFTNTDVQSLLNALQAGGGSTSPVPEPAAFDLLAVGILLFFLRPVVGMARNLTWPQRAR
ncbi:MAG TPA: dockerin type I domain-containing protein, partial [Pirellulales bacterium]|nr:dockerin type I domain-containing protein [Pirellulales bacterium]